MSRLLAREATRWDDKFLTIAMSERRATFGNMATNLPHRDPAANQRQSYCNQQGHSGNDQPSSKKTKAEYSRKG